MRSATFNPDQKDHDSHDHQQNSQSQSQSQSKSQPLTTNTLSDSLPPAPYPPHTDSATRQAQLTALQQHVLFWDRDNDGIIYPWDVYNGFRALGFNVLFSLGSLLIPIFFSYPTTLGHSWFPDPWFRIFVGSLHKAKHGSDSNIFDVDGHFHMDRFDAMFDRWDEDRIGGLTADQMWAMWKKNRCAADPAGWCFGFMEWWTTWLLMQRKGRVWKDDLRACYDGTLFWNISHKTQRSKNNSEKCHGSTCAWDQGYGVGDFFEGLWKGRTWRTWELRKQQKQL
ncbi:Peroxygenase [Exophiala dermatitidis]